LPPPERQHLDCTDLEDLLAWNLAGDRRRHVLGHLVAGCPGCRARVRHARRLAFRLVPPASRLYDYDAAIGRALLRADALWRHELAEQRAGAALWAAVRQLPPGWRSIRLLNSPRHHTAGVLLALLDDYREAERTNLAEALDLAALALALAERLAPDWTGAARLADLRTTALVHAANAHRLAGSNRRATSLLVRAARTQQQGSGEPLLEADLLTAAGRLWQARRHFERAAQTFAAAEDIYRKIGDAHGVAGSLVARARAIGHHHPRQGIRLIRRALPDLDAGLDPQLELAAHHHLAWYLHDAGQIWDAQVELRASAGLYLRDGGNALASLERAWLRGRIARSLLEFDEARRAYGLARSGFEDLGVEAQLTLVAIDRAELEVAQGELTGAAALLADTLARVIRWGVSRGTLTILYQLRESVLTRRCRRASFRQAALAVRSRWAPEEDDDPDEPA
jgi:tetratricopeptide (TPR) repeat protein